MVEKKVRGAKVIAPPKAERSVPSFKVSPLSNKIIIRVIIVKTGPTAPKREGEDRPNTGPTQIPIIIRKRTSGILVRLNIPVKRWARNIKIPTKAIIEAVSCMLLRLVIFVFDIF